MKDLPTKLLLVEDNRGDAGLLRAALSEVAGIHFRLTHVERLAEALQCLQEMTVDLVLLDLSLPDARGLETVSRLRAQNPAMPIVVLTGLNDEELAVEALRQGAQDYLVKGQIDNSMLVRSMRYGIERKKSEKQIQSHRERQAALHEINLAITSTLDLHTVLDILLEKISQMLPYAATTVRLLNKETGSMDPVACRNIDEREWKTQAPSGGGGLARLVFESMRPVTIADVLGHPQARYPDFMRHNGLVSYLGVPLIVRGEFLGVLAFYTRHRHEFGHEEIEYLSTLGGQAAIAIHNSRLYERIKSSNEALEKALQVKSVLLGVMSHELRTPIQVIMGTAGLLAEGVCGQMSEEQKQRLNLIETNAEDLLKLIQGTLDMTRMEQGKMPLRVEEISVAGLLGELGYEFADAFLKSGVRLDVDKPDTDHTIKTDRVKLKEILRNLLENARKFTPQGKVELGCRSIEPDRVEFTVKDSGIGIKKEMLPNIFDLFYQVDAAAQKEGTGAGLGLNIVKRLVELLAGEISVGSEFGKGTTFRIVLPREANLTTLK